MSTPGGLRPSLSRQRVAQVALATAVVVAGAVIVVSPAYRVLAVFSLYIIPAHLLISLLPSEPAILYVAKLYPPWLVSTVGTLWSLVAIALDYWLIGWFVNHGLIKSKLDNSKIFLFAHRVFRKAPFVLIAACALLPVPFYPVKILAIAAGYSIVLFVLAAVIGRWPRFYLLSIGGRTFQAPNSWLLGVAIVLEVLIVVGIWRTRQSSLGSRQT